MLPQRHGHYVPGPSPEPAACTKGAVHLSKSLLDFHLTQELFCFVQTSMQNVPIPKEKQRTKQGTNLAVVCQCPPQTLHPRGEEFWRLLLPLRVTAWLGGLSERLVPVGVRSAGLPLQKRDFWSCPFGPAYTHYDLPSRHRDRVSYLYSYQSTLTTLPRSFNWPDMTAALFMLIFNYYLFTSFFIPGCKYGLSQTRKHTLDPAAYSFPLPSIRFPSPLSSYCLSTSNSC